MVVFKIEAFDGEEKVELSFGSKKELVDYVIGHINDTSFGKVFKETHLSYFDSRGESPELTRWVSSLYKEN